jgi:monoamine oxidase
VVGGYSTLVESLYRALAGTVQVRTNAIVRTITWRQGHVTIEAGSNGEEPLRVSAKQVVITLPLGVLQQKPDAAGAVRFDPPLNDKNDALKLLAMGPVTRIILQLESVLWEDRDVLSAGVLKDLHFLFSKDHTFPTYWSAMPLRLPILVAWAAGPLATAKRAESHRQIELEALQALARILSLPDRALGKRLVRSYFHDWQNDPFSRGAYSYVLAGGIHAQRDLARPLCDTLFFAGEATQDDGHHATVHGAFNSGVRAADELLNGRG